MLTTGTRVRLNTPENPRLHGAAAVVDELTAYGAVVRTQAAATGVFRALHSEMVAAPAPSATGDICSTCGGCNMIRAGSCLCCQDCGTTTGCS